MFPEPSLPELSAVPGGMIRDGQRPGHHRDEGTPFEGRLRSPPPVGILIPVIWMRAGGIRRNRAWTDVKRRNRPKED